MHQIRSTILTYLAVLATFILPAAALAQDEDATRSEDRDYVFVFITTGDSDGDLAGEARSEAFAGHFSNMRRMAEAGDLLIAGPFGPPMGRPDHRGLFVFDAKTIDEGMEHAETDPTYQAGVFKLTGHLLTTEAPLTTLHEMDMQAMEELGENPPPGANARAYVLATAFFDEAHYEQASAAEGLLIAAKLHAHTDDEPDRVILWLDAENEESAKTITSALEGDWTLHGWYGSKSIAQLSEEN